MEGSGPPVMPARAGQEAADGTVGGDRVADRPYRAELVGTVRSGHEDPAQVERWLLRVLGVVEPIAAALPDVQGGTVQWHAHRVRHLAADQGGAAVLRAAGPLSPRANGRPRCVEG